MNMNMNMNIHYYTMMHPKPLGFFCARMFASLPEINRHQFAKPIIVTERLPFAPLRDCASEWIENKY